jgi:hypothetical protein
MQREIFKQELVKFAKWYQMEEMQRKEKKLFTAIVDDYMQNIVLPQAIVITSVCVDCGEDFEEVKRCTACENNKDCPM